VVASSGSEKNLIQLEPPHWADTVSVIIPCWNAQSWIERSIRSAIGQHCPGLEVILVDDGSSDSSLEIARSFGNSIRCLVSPHRGACAARNAGLACSTAEWVLFLDADDYLDPGSLRAWTRAAAETHSDLLLAPFAYEIDGRRYPGVKRASPEAPLSILCGWLDGRFTPPCSVLWRRSFVIAIGGWNEALPRNQDGELVIRGLLNHAQVGIAYTGCGIYVQHSGEGRVSKRVGREILICEITTLLDLWRTALTQGYAGSRLAFAHALYRVAYDAFVYGADDIGRRALANARSLGFLGHIGSWQHRVLACIIGLKLKLKLASFLKGRFRY
jgi:glycosyltransferase involved in cell wall biosynthesis